MISCTISNVAVEVLNNSFTLTDPLEQDTTLVLTVIDHTGTANFTRGQPVEFSDSIAEIDYVGYVNTSAPIKPGLASALIEHLVTCMGTRYRLNKRTNSKNYLAQYTGDIVTDFIDSTLAAEGVTAPYATHRDSTTADFNTGILSGTAGYTDGSDGDLELLKAGSDLTIAETTTANFASGTLTNVTATGNALTPTSTTAISCSAILSGALTGAYMAVKIWSGSMTVGTLDTLNYDIWISGLPATCGVDLYFSDGSKMSTATTIPVDQNSISSAPTTDLSGFANSAWYTRNIPLLSGLNAKVINSVVIVLTGASAGTYTAYVKNAYLTSQSGNKFFAVGATTTNVNPPQSFGYVGFQLSSLLSSVVNVFIADNANRVSSSYSIDIVKLLRSSLITWIAAQSLASVSISASYDGGASYAVCTNNAALPALPPGTNVAGLSIRLKESFMASGSTDPTVFPILNSVNVTLLSAPNATKSDIVQSYITNTNWNTGTYGGDVVLSGNTITVGPTSRNWNDNLITSQTFTVLAGSPVQSASSGKYNITNPSGAGALSSLDFAGVANDFIYDIDVTVGSGTAALVYYRNPTKNTSKGYYLQLNAASGTIFLLRDPGTVVLGSITSAITGGSTYHLKIIVKGSLHTIYLGGVLYFTVTDATYPDPGYFVLGSEYVTGSATCSFDNAVISPGNTGTWQSSSVSISSLTTCGLSAIYWAETGTTNQSVANILVQTSIDGGSTFQTCTNNGPIPNLTSGTNVTGKTIIVLVTMNTISNTATPILSQLVWRVLGAYPGSSGTRSTIPLGNDTMVRANQSGAGTAFDGQPYTKVGTGTDAIASKKLTITNTTGDVHEVLGTRTGTDLDGTVEFSLDASADSGGMELRYVDVNNFYRLQITTTTISIVKKLSGVATTLATASVTLSINTAYWMRFRVVGANPATLTGRVWASGVLEPTAWQVTASG